MMLLQRQFLLLFFVVFPLTSFAGGELISFNTGNPYTASHPDAQWEEIKNTIVYGDTVFGDLNEQELLEKVREDEEGTVLHPLHGLDEDDSCVLSRDCGSSDRWQFEEGCVNSFIQKFMDDTKVPTIELYNSGDLFTEAMILRKLANEDVRRLKIVCIDKKYTKDKVHQTYLSPLRWLLKDVSYEFVFFHSVSDYLDSKEGHEKSHMLISIDFLSDKKNKNEVAKDLFKLYEKSLRKNGIITGILHTIDTSAHDLMIPYVRPLTGDDFRSRNSLFKTLGKYKENNKRHACKH